jgi:hypothetical protein
MVVFGDRLTTVVRCTPPPSPAVPWQMVSLSSIKENEPPCFLWNNC